MEEKKTVPTKRISTKTASTNNTSTKTVPTTETSTNFYISLAVFLIITTLLIAASIYFYLMKY